MTDQDLNINISLALPEDREELMQLFRACTSEMNRKGLFNWNENYPDRQTVENDLENDSLYVLRTGGRITAAVTLNKEEPEEYLGISWTIKKGKIMVVHRLAVDPAFQRKGLAKQMMIFAEDLAVSQEYDCIHMDAYSINIPARSLYQRLGYRELEEFYFPGFDIPFRSMEKNFING